MFSVILLSIAMSIDAIGIGITFGIRKIAMGKSACLITAIVGMAIIGGGLAMGEAIGILLPLPVAKLSGGLILLAIGSWIIIQCRPDPKETDLKPIRILRSPQDGDINRSGAIEPSEALFIGLALSLDSVGVCIGTMGSIEYPLLLPPVAVIFQLLFLLTGRLVGIWAGNRLDTRLCTILSGLIIILLGIWEICV